MSDVGRQIRRGPPLTLVVLMAAIIGAHFLVSGLSAERQNLLFYEFAIIPARFDQASQYHFTAAYEALGPLLGHVFLHAGILHLGMNMLVLLQAGPWVADRLGGARFLALFFASALGGAGAYIVINAHSELPAVGASGAICGVFGAYFLSVRRSWREALADRGVLGAIASFLFINVFLAGLASVSGFLPIAWEAHLGGFLAGAAAYLVLAPRSAPGPWG